MSLNAALTTILDNYPIQSKRNFRGNSLADLIRNNTPNIIRSIITNNDRYLVEGSAGRGQWARIPWIAIFDKLITDSAQHGYYIVYLAREDFSGIYLSLNQGVTTVREQYGAEAKHALQIRANNFLAQLGTIPNNYIRGPIDLKAQDPSSLGAYYEVGSICAKLYRKGNLPQDHILEQDLRHLLSLYLELATKELLAPDTAAKEDDELQVHYEDLRLLREHKRIERNQKLAKRAKEIHGYTCQVCDFNFEKSYGPIGQNYIEAHHLTPLSHLKGQKIKLDPRTDFAVLCANCHRMIHRTDQVNDIEAFKINHYNTTRTT